MSERRAHYRVTTRGMRVTLTSASTPHTGTVGDTTAAGASVSFPFEGAPTIPLGTRLELVFSGGPLPAPVPVMAVLRSRSEGDFRRYGFAFDEPGRFGGGLPATAFGTFNRREWVRLAPERPVVAKVEVFDGPSAGTLLEGRLGDVSRGGLAFLLAAGAEDHLGEALHVRCTFRPAGAEAEETYTCALRNRQVVAEGVRYGAAFVGVLPEETPLAPPVYERFWNCGSCDTVRLLEQTHPHCPNCGARPRHEHTYFPSWDEVVTAADHPFSGEARACGCGARWGAAARHCGRCGKSLGI